jgi:hypothetical protein
VVFHGVFSRYASNWIPPNIICDILANIFMSLRPSPRPTLPRLFPQSSEPISPPTSACAGAQVFSSHLVSFEQ